MAKAIGGLVWNVTIDDTKARKGLQALRADVRNTNKEWKTSYDLAMANNKVSEALSIKIDGLGKAYEKNNRYLEYQKNILKTTQQEYGENSLKAQKLATSVEKTRINVQRLSNQQELAIKQNIRVKTGIDELTTSHRNSVRALEANAKALKDEGSQLDYNKAKVDTYKRSLSNLQEEIGLEQKALKEMKDKGYENTEMFKQQETRISSLRSEISRTKDEQRRFGEGLEDLNYKNQKNISSMQSTVQMLKDSKQHFKAQVVQLEAVKNESKLLVDQREREGRELKALGDKYGQQSAQYANQKRKVSDLTGKIVYLNQKQVELNRSTNGSYGFMSKLGDMADRNAGTFQKAGGAIHGVGVAMSGASALMFGALVDGTKDSFKLQQTYSRTENLINATNEESASAVSDNIKKAKDQNAQLSEQFGESQQSLADTQQVLVKRGYTSNQMLGAMKPLLEASTASGDKLNDVVKVSTSALESFGMKAKGTQQTLEHTKKAVNTIAFASDKSASSFQSTGIAMSYVGSTAHTAGVSVDQTASAIGILSNNGVKLLPSLSEMIA